MEGGWSLDHPEFLDARDCDVWLLTEVPNAFALGGREPAWSEPMDSGRLSPRPYATAAPTASSRLGPPSRLNPVLGTNSL